MTNEEAKNIILNNILVPVTRHNGKYQARYLTLEAIQKAVEALEVADVVRCKDCCHSQYDEEHDWYLCYANFCTIHEGDFYCAAGEQKEKEDDKR